MIKNFLFKPILIKSNNLEKLVIIFNLESSTSKTVNASGAEILRDKTYVEILDISGSIATGNPVTEIIEVADENKLVQNFEVLDPSEVIEELEEVSKILTGNISFLKQRIESITNAGNSILFASSHNDGEGNLIIGSDSGKLAHIVFNTIQGNTASLSDTEVKSIGSVIMDTMISNLNIDLDDDKEVNKFIGELELKIIESLPQSLKAGNITINKNGLLNEIRSCKEEFLTDEDEETL